MFVIVGVKFNERVFCSETQDCHIEIFVAFSDEGVVDPIFNSPFDVREQTGLGGTFGGAGFICL